ncbi:hypothetical protein MKX03_024721 [Papaver bracteatum]|nr:hypothetical protein MKX03_024721 [Papaver bracteatum]
MSTIRADEISTIIHERIEQYNREVKVVNTGTVLQLGDGIARIHGLDEVMAGELVEFEEGTIGVALNLESNNVGVVLMGDGLMIQEGSSVKETGRIAQILVSEDYLGRVVNALAKPNDGRGEISSSESRLIESPAPGIISRRSEYEPLQTGLISIDSMIPVGRGQRELIIGDMQTGKTTVSMDTVLNQKWQNVVCVYVAIGQKASSVAQVVTTFQEHGAMDYTIMVTEMADSPATLQYLAPYTGAALAEYFMYLGSTAQIKAMKQVADKLKLELDQFAELEVFAQFSSNLDKATQNQLARGQQLCKLLKQAQSTPLIVEEHVMTIYTGTNGYLDLLEIDQVKKFLFQLRTYLKTNKPQLQEIISSTKKFPEEAEVLLKEAIKEQMERFLLQEQA